MERKILNKIISFLKEQPTMNVGDVGYTSKGDQTRAGFDPVQGKMMKRRKQSIGKWSRSLRKKGES
tara:strand:- start:88 stop:285 length:198 start_codon:yes stop_codon:yes gene_type:complete